MDPSVVTLLDAIRRTVAGRPLWLFLGFLLVSMLVSRMRGRRPGGSEATLRFAQIASILALAYYACLVAWYVWVPQQSDAAEPSITAVAWLFSLGKPVYHALDSAERYSHMYGPMAFIVPGAFLQLFGPNMFVAKAVGVAAALLAIAFTGLAVRSADSKWRTALIACGICVLELLIFRNRSFWSRPEPLQLLSVGAGLYAAARMNAAPATLAIALSMGVLSNLKFTGPLYGLPIFALFYVRWGGRPLALSVLGTAVVAILPFVLFPNVSWTDYILWVRLSADNGLRVAALKENLEWGLFLLVPVLVRLSAPSPLSPAMRLMVPSLLLGLCGVLVAASKPGAGPYHFVPFLPIIAYVFAASDLPARLGTGPLDCARDRPAWLASFLATLIVVTAIQQEYFFRLTADRQLADSYGDVADYLARRPNEIVEIGYTSAERMTFARTLAVFRTGKYLLDVPAIQEHQLSGLSLPGATVLALRSCSVDAWLIPSGGAPFHIRNDYPSTGYAEIFPPEFIAAFQGTYRLEERTRYYDVWRCSRGPS